MENITEISIIDGAKGFITPKDLLNVETSIISVFNSSFLIKNTGYIFKVNHEGFYFRLAVDNGILFFERNRFMCCIDINEFPSNTEIRVIAMWNPTKLFISASIPMKLLHEGSVDTPPCFIPLPLLRYVREKNLLPTKEYNSVEEFRQTVHSCFISIQEIIDTTGAINAFWNIKYEGKKIVSRSPKLETDVHPTIYSLLYNQFFLLSIEVMTEFKTGIGNVDFLLMANIKNQGMAKIVVEFKNAHSKDLIHGFTEQLPSYMKNTNSQYGIYCVLNYKSEYFKKPKKSYDINLFQAKIESKNPWVQNIREIDLYLGKSQTASKK
jgi:hypothetical protein